MNETFSFFCPIVVLVVHWAFSIKYQPTPLRIRSEQHECHVSMIGKLLGTHPRPSVYFLSWLGTLHGTDHFSYICGRTTEGGLYLVSTADTALKLDNTLPLLHIQSDQTTEEDFTLLVVLT